MRFASLRRFWAFTQRDAVPAPSFAATLDQQMDAGMAVYSVEALERSMAATAHSSDVSETITHLTNESNCSNNTPPETSGF